MVKYTWVKGEYPKDIVVTQVYGVTFKGTKILIMKDEEKYHLIGGKPEKGETFEDTLIREFYEEVNTDLEDVHYLGYFIVEEDNKKYAQVRMIAKIKKINEERPDLDNGKIYERKLVEESEVLDYLEYYDQIGISFINDAIELAKEKYQRKGE